MASAAGRRKRKDSIDRTVTRLLEEQLNLPFRSGILDDEKSSEKPIVL